jgi:hypothetical protein
MLTEIFGRTKYGIYEEYNIIRKNCTHSAVGADFTEVAMGCEHSANGQNKEYERNFCLEIFYKVVT